MNATMRCIPSGRIGSQVDTVQGEDVVGVVLFAVGKWVVAWNRSAVAEDCLVTAAAEEGEAFGRD